MDAIVNLNLTQTKMWHPTEPTIEEEDHLFSFSSIFEALHKADKPSIYVEPQTLKCNLMTANINPETMGYLLVSTICNTFSCQEVSYKFHTE